MWKYNGRTIRVGKAWVDDNGIQHPPNWHIWSPSDKAAAGLTEIVEETPPDSRLYTWSMGSDGKISKTAKTLADTDAVDGAGNKIKDEDGNQVINRGVKYNLKQEVKTSKEPCLLKLIGLLSEKLTRVQLYQVIYKLGETLFAAKQLTWKRL